MWFADPSNHVLFSETILSSSDSKHVSRLVDLTIFTPTELTAAATVRILRVRPIFL